jgi:predicted 3-demethylubiquinone-9 3-methyltransferase (glyoxalase superfamily)/uncharacterized protein YndB with AHSA1/START domain
MKLTEALQVTTPSEREIMMTRAFAAPRNLVFDAFTKPELVKRWLLEPPGWSMPVCEIDLRVGGAYRYVWRHDRDGTTMGMGGVYHEIVAPKRLVTTERFDEAWYPGEAVGTLVLVEQGERTTVTQTMLSNRGKRATRSSSPAWSGVWRRATTGSTDSWHQPRHGDNREERIMQRIVPFLWFDGKAEEAMNFYVSVFKHSKVVRVTRYGEAGPGPKGTVMSATFQLEGQDFYALNGGPQYSFTPAVSFFVSCETQQEVDELWEKLSAGGRKDRCGWLQDKYGLSWQIIPTALGKMLQDKDPAKAGRVMQAMLQMEKIDIQRLEQAYRG